MMLTRRRSPPGLNPAFGSPNGSGPQRCPAGFSFPRNLAKHSLSLAMRPWLKQATIAGAAVISFLHSARAAESSIDPTTAAQYFAEARELCERDGGKLWGHSL